MHVLYLCLFIFHVSYVKCNYKVLCFCEIPFHVQASSVFVTVTVFQYASVSVCVPVCVCVCKFAWNFEYALLIYKDLASAVLQCSCQKCEILQMWAAVSGCLFVCLFESVCVSVYLCVSLHVSKVSSIILFDICVCVLVSHLTLFCLLS